MKFIYFDLALLAIAILFVIIFLYKRKKKIQRQGIIFLYPTQVGVKLMDRIAKKYKKFLHVTKYFAISLGYVLMVGILYLFWLIVHRYLISPSQIPPELVKVPPLLPVIPYFPQIFGLQGIFPPFYFIYFILAILVVAVVHEGAHGLYMRLYNVRIKSTGFLFLGPLIGAFVEQDEKQMKKASRTGQMAILSSGVFANIITAIIFGLLLIGMFFVAFVPAGATFDTYIYSPVAVSNITMIGGVNITNPSHQGLIDLIEENDLTTDLTIDMDGESVELTKIKTKDHAYFIRLDNFKEQLEQETDVLLYNNLPAINAGLKGTIIEINNQEIKNYNDLANEMTNYNPGDKITIKTNFQGEIQEYEIELADVNGRGVMGIANYPLKNNLINNVYTLFRKPYTHYEERNGFGVFIYHLLFWIFLINLLVAFFNMIPASIFDGGRFFYLTVLGITKREKIAKGAFKFMGYLFLIILFLIMFSWLFRF